MSEPSPTRVREIFEEVVALRIEQRESLLVERCGNDQATRSEVEALLRAQQSVGDFLRGATLDPQSAAGSGQGDQTPPARVGPYKILETIGEGGFGTVYLAEQESPIRRRVALKIIKPGMDTRRVIARFEAERQALAMMDHPNIARVFEAGATDTGRPFFAMELVGGVSITEYCDAKKLNAKERLELFVPICQAVQHAHQKGVIHRDIKPTNVLVTESDGRAVPKVIDFGVAKAIDARLTEKTLFTEFREFIGTPEYMSPEQAQIGGIDVDTRSDVYSLGVLLYELLAGSPPFDGRELRQKAFEEMQRIIREVDPPAPSTKLSTSDRIASLAAQRSTEPRKLSAIIRGELDWIALKCLEKDRSRRYESASALANDVTNYLAGDPVNALPASRFYLARKFARRHRWGIGVACAIGLALVIGLTLAIVGERRARLAFREAEEQRKISVAVNAFLSDMLQSADPLRGAGKDITVVKALDEANKTIDSRFGVSPAVQSAIHQTIGNSYLNLGRAADAVANLKSAYETRKKLFGENAKDTVTSENDYAVALANAGEPRLAEPIQRDGLTRVEKIYGMDSLEAIKQRGNLGVLLIDLNQVAEASRLLAGAYEQAQRICEPDDEQLANACANAAYAASNIGKPEDSARLYRRAIELFTTIKGPDYISTLSSRQNLASVLDELHQPAEAEVLLRDNVARQEKLLGANHPDTLFSLNALATALAKQGKFDEAMKITRDLLPRIVAVKGADSIEAITVESNVGHLLHEQKQFAEAESSIRQTLGHARRVLGEHHRVVALLESNLAATLGEQGKTVEAVQLCVDAIAQFKAIEGAQSPKARGACNALSEILRRTGHADEARQLEAALNAVSTTLPSSR